MSKYSKSSSAGDTTSYAMPACVQTKIVDYGIKYIEE